MNACLFLLTFIVFNEYAESGQTKKHGLYSPSDDVTILTNENFYDHFLDKENAWLIEFYNSWCGHCINFAPTWKKFATYAKGWVSVLSVGAVDCSNANNSGLCRTFDTQGYPTMLFFRPHANKNSSHHTATHTLAGGHDFDSLVSFSFKCLDSINSTAPPSWPRLQPLKTIQEIWTEAKEHHEYVFLIFEDPKSVLGREVILDTMNLPSILVRRMLKADVTKFGINTFPSLYSVNKDGIYKKVVVGDYGIQDRSKFVSAIQVFSGKKVASNNTMHSLVKVGDKKEDEDQEMKNEGDGEGQYEQGKEAEDRPPQSALVHMKDLESALHYSLKQEVAIKSSIDEEGVTALKNFITILVKYFPGREEIISYLNNVKKWLNTVTGQLRGEAWSRQLDAIQAKGSFLPDDVTWVGCAGSETRYRGYPCGMWTLFHTLTVSSHLSHLRTNPQEVLLGISGYMKNFFGCEECSHNFLKMASTVEQEVHEGSDTVLWLWRAHNKANKRLHGDLSEDPQHPKLQFPSRTSCPKCHKDNTDWDEAQVLTYLVGLYRRDNIVSDSRQTALKDARVRDRGELDWWEKHQRAQDLEKIHTLRKQKKVAFQQKMERQIWEQARRSDSQENIHQDRQYHTLRKGWGLNGVDLGMCMMFYVMCAVIILLMYYHFTIRRNWKPCGCLPV
ncbi:sulfhydryl oxidase 2-like [Haliotis cracherodii]|uniref:sulfhydryl oxidase 2-like n=1 Tax=Haliotis cracherodii TaxID=6455 RepID=UPI0039E8D68F